MRYILKPWIFGVKAPMVTITLLLISIFSLKCGINTVEETAVGNETKTSPDQNEANPEDNNVPELTSFKILCVNCSFTYGIRWRTDSDSDWHELSPSDDYPCLYTGDGSTDILSSCFDIKIETNQEISSTIYFIDIEAQNAYGVYSDAGCHGAFLESEEYQNYQFACFP